MMSEYKLAKGLGVLLAGMVLACGSPSIEGSEQDASSSSAQPEAAEKNEPPNMTSGQKNALRSAQNYIDTMPFSKAGLIQQLSSPAGDKYSKADATFAAEHVKADWKAEAAEAAENYLETMPMSRDALVEQLSSSAGDKFTKAEAEYGADKALK